MTKLLGNDAGTLRTTPWARREAGGVYIGHDKSVWLYRELPLAPLQHEDPTRRLEVGRSLEVILDEIGARSRDIGQGIALFSQNRSIHLFAVTYSERNTPPEGTPERLEEFLKELLSPVTTRKTFLLGVKLRSAALQAAVKASGGVAGKAKALLKPRSDEVEMSLSAFENDFNDMDAVMRRLGGMYPSRHALAQLEAWWNQGKTPDSVNEFDDDSFRVAGAGTYQVRAVMEMPMTLSAPFSQWLLDAMSHESPAVAVSIRAELEPPTVTRARLRHQRRKLISQEEEERATGDLGREENSSKLQSAEDIESYVINSRTPWLTNASILMAREVDNLDDTYAEHLEQVYGIKTEPLFKRQLEALDEFQPASGTRINPFPQDLNLAMAAYAGLASFSSLGDANGVFLGHVDPDFVPCFLEPFAAARENTPPVMGLFGDPGSGKAQTLDALLLTPDGWVRMGDIRVGDYVIGSAGTPTAVTGVFPQGTRPMYRITFTDGAAVECDPEHLWTVTPTGHPGRREVKTLSQLIPEVLDHEGNPRWEIPLVQPVQHPHRDLHADPYETGRQAVSSGAGVDDIALFSSVSQRTDILQGAVDTLRGTPGPLPPRFTLNGSSPAVRDSIRHLVWSLGGTAALTDASDTWALDVHLPRTVVTSPKASSPRRLIADISYVGEKEAQCIRVAAEDHLYVTEDYVVTHNTFAAQLIAGQAAIAGLNVFFVNPKGFDSLDAWVQWVKSYGVPARTVSLSKIESQGGAFDPFSFCADPKMAAEILTRHIQTALGDALNPMQNFTLAEGLVRGAENGARCAMDALKFVEDTEMVRLIHGAVRSSSLFALGFSNVPRNNWENTSGLTLIEFDRELPLPGPGKAFPEPAERIALAALRLTSRAAMELLMRTGGGVYVIDEAHHYISSPEGMASLDRLAREGRSVGLLPVFITQRPSDLLNVDMESFMSRVLCMKLNDAAQAQAALKLCRLEPTAERVRFLRDAGPRRGGDGVPGRPALGILRDLHDQHAVVTIGPVPEHMRLAMSTNRTDREVRAAQGRAPGKSPIAEVSK